MKVLVENNFYVAGDFVISLANGAFQEVVHLVTRPEDASAFGLATANNIKQFVESRVNSRRSGDPPVKFSVVHSVRPEGLWIIHGVQEVLIDAEG